MNMRHILPCTETDYAVLAEIWERSVRATHDFLGEEDIREIKKALVSDYFPNVRLYSLVDEGNHKGFIGLSGDKIEMLFVDGPERGKGIGRALIGYAVRAGANAVDVNEQNPEALKFYELMGFQVVGRDETDDAGRPYPILHLSLVD